MIVEFKISKHRNGVDKDGEVQLEVSSKDNRGWHEQSRIRELYRKARRERNGKANTGRRVIIGRNQLNEKKAGLMCLRAHNPCVIYSVTCSGHIHRHAC